MLFLKTKAFKQIKRTSLVALAKLFIGVVNQLPRRLALTIGSWLGLVIWWVSVKDQHRIARHLKMVYRESKSFSERHLIGRRFFVNSAKNLIDVVRSRRHYVSQIKPLMDVTGLEHYEKALKDGHGIIGLTAHLGNFEMIGTYLSSIGYPIAVIGRRMYDDRLDELLVGGRQAMGITNFYTTDSARTILKWLKNGGVIGVLMDTDSFRVRSMMVPAFGRLSYTPIGHIAMAVQVGATIIPSFCLRTDDDRYKVLIKPPIRYELTGDKEKDIYRVAAMCNKVVDETIKEYPEQWIWLHNRWHSSPEVLAKQEQQS